MGRSRLHTQTTIFVVTSNGKLRRIRPTWITLLGLIILGLTVLFSRECFLYNSQLMSQERTYQSELIKLNDSHQELISALTQCEQRKKQIGGLLNFNTDTGKTTNDTE